MGVGAWGAAQRSCSCDGRNQRSLLLLLLLLLLVLLPLLLLLRLLPLLLLLQVVLLLLPGLGLPSVNSPLLLTPPSPA